VILNIIKGKAPKGCRPLNPEKEAAMTKYIGLDAHSSTCTFNVTDERGREIDNTTLETNGRLRSNI